MKNTVLVLDDDPLVCDVLREDLPSHGFEVAACGSLAEARRILQEQPVQAILTDYRLPDGTGAEFYRDLRQKDPSVPVIFMTSFPDLEQAVELMKEGAADYILKPISIGDVASRLRRAMDARALRAEVHFHRRRALPSSGRLELMGHSPAIERVRRAIMEIARAPQTPVLITGETGAGKEVVARLIHQTAYGDSKPFIDVDCATISRQLFESELFGHERGAFTGADRVKEGIFELGKDGTIFLDEIGEVELDLQSRLLRVLETRTFRRVGGIHPLEFGARVIAATNRDVPQLLARHEFRADLYYRLAVCQIHVPPLRERKEDLRDLAAFFLKESAARLGKPLTGFSDRFLALLDRHSFPGNVRELRNLVEQAVIQSASGQADLRESMVLPFPTTPSTNEPQGATGDEEAMATLAERERQAILAALKDQGGNKSAAARQLGISRPSLLRRVARLWKDSPPPV